MIEKTAKEAIIRKAFSRGTQTLAQVAKENNVALGTLAHWLNKSRASSQSSGKAIDGLIDLGERYKHLKATFGQTDVIVGAYCRQHGLYPHQLAQWETEFMTNSPPSSKQQPSVEIKALQIEVKEIKKTIMLKDKVLAETMALLILKKKAAQIWGDSEDD